MTEFRVRPIEEIFPGDATYFGEHHEEMAKIVRWCQDDPIVAWASQEEWTQYQAQQARGEKPYMPLTTAVQVVAEQRVMAARICLRSQLFFDLGYEADFNPAQRDPVRSESEKRLYFANLMLRATPYLWAHEIRHAAMSMAIPSHIMEKELFPAWPPWWWSWETSLMPNTTRGTPFYEADGMLFSRVGDRFGVFEAGVNRERVTTVTLTTYPLGGRYPEDIEEKEHEALGALLGMMSFINSEYIEKEKKLVERTPRKAGKRLGRGHDVNTLVTIVHLRRAEKEISADPTPRSDAAAREYKCQWLVRGHIRAQWYPSKKEHRLIHVPPHIKGPAGAPMKTKVFKVDR
jgi:hypothetical protein